ncbi:hypothetical protein HAX54_023092 [Datura stramonium]|uniref:Uncharacterized protein n=1 Tax=Datura stramonium TaxID=4076 RepID=A0ABS8UY33_DATST|nr:hypothetical protein [Datura stramonium]
MKGGENCDGLGAFGGGTPMAMTVEGCDIPVRETRRVGDVEGDGVEEEGVWLMCVMCFIFGGVWQFSMLEKTTRRMVMESLGMEKYIEEQNESSNYVLIVNKYREPTRDENGIGLAPHR